MPRSVPDANRSLITNSPWTGSDPNNEDELDALLGAVVAREGLRGGWKDLATNDRNPDELDPKRMWFGPVAYWWPP